MHELPPLIYLVVVFGPPAIGLWIYFKKSEGLERPLEEIFPATDHEAAVASLRLLKRDAALWGWGSFAASFVGAVAISLLF